MRKVLQVPITKDLLFDLENYCKENDLKPTDLVRYLLRIELYNEQTMSKKRSTLTLGTLNAPRRAGKSKKD